MKIFETVADAKAAKNKPGQKIETKGYYTAGDGGAATYLVKTAAEYGGTPDGYGDHYDATGNVLVLQHNGTVDVKQFGAKGDGVTNDYEALNAAKNYVGSKFTLTIADGGTYFIGDNEFVIDISGFRLVASKGATIEGNGGQDGGFIVSVASAGGTAQPSTSHPVNVSLTGLTIRSVSPFAASGGRAALRVCGSYSLFTDVSVTTSGDNGGNGIRLESDNTGSGPYYNTFIDCNVQGPQNGTASGTGVMMRQKAGTTFATRYPNANTWIGGRVGGYLVNYEIVGTGNRFYGPTSENTSGYGKAFHLKAPVAVSTVGNTVSGAYIENADEGYLVDAGCSGNTIVIGYYSGIATNAVNDLGTDTVIVGNYSTDSSGKFPRGIFVGNSNTPFDVFDEGTWTPTLVGSTITGDYTLSIGSASYTRVGKRVFLEAQFSVTVNSAGSGTARFGGLPFTKRSGGRITGSVWSSNVGYGAGTISLSPTEWTSGADDTFSVRSVKDSSAATSLDISGISSGSSFTLFLTYEVA